MTKGHKIHTKMTLLGIAKYDLISASRLSCGTYQADSIEGSVP